MRGSAALAGIAIAATATFSCVASPREDLVAFYATILLSTGLLVGALILGREGFSRSSAPRVLFHLVLTGVCLRLAASLAPTSLSDDVFRYVWDGK
ncbi:MAG: hypothetical protein KC561_16440, partial [Myxococcales bacterium]|nr:hypothetical protein [Myxococcales bacterium]